MTLWPLSSPSAAISSSPSCLAGSPSQPSASESHCLLLLHLLTLGRCLRSLMLTLAHHYAPHPGPWCAIISALPGVSWLQVSPFIHTHPKIQQRGIKLVAVVVVGCWVGTHKNGAAGWEHQTVSSAPGTKGCLPSCQFWQDLASRKIVAHLIKSYSSHLFFWIIFKVWGNETKA